MDLKNKKLFNPLEHPVCFMMPRRNLSSAWMEHVPFAFYLMDILRPKVFVELGTFYGVSYCAFCQAVDELKLPTSCHAVDTWSGDEHTGAYDTSVLDDLRQHHDPLYGTFSKLHQCTFDEAVKEFDDGTIDLLHIDGYHTYEAVKHDFETWKPKLSRQGVVIFHDTNERSGNFGVWRLLDELKQQYPYFEFMHGHGLGIVAVGKDVPQGLIPLLNTSQDEGDLIRKFFYEMGQRIALSAALLEKTQTEFNLRSDLQIKTRELEKIQSTIFFQLLALPRKIFRRMFPEQSRGRRLINKGIREMVAIVRSIPALLELVQKRITFWRQHGSLNLFRKVWFVLKARYALFVYARRASRSRRIPAGDDFDVFEQKPLISVVIPTYNTPLKYLQIAVQSVFNQYYTNWELCICDDGSSDTTIKEWLKSIAGERVKIIFSETNAGISSATNRAVMHSSGEFIAFLDHDDALSADALFEMVRLLNQQPDLDVIYSDQDKIDHRGRHSEPFFKPDWSPEYFRSVMYIGHLVLMRRRLFDQVGGLDSSFDGIQDYELMLRVSEQTTKIAHIPKVLYHWRKIPGSVALGLNEKGEKIQQLQARAVNAHLKRTQRSAEAGPHPVHPHRVIIKPKPRLHYPKVSIIILSKDAYVHLSRCLKSIFEKTTYPNYEVIVVDNGTSDPLVLRLLKESPVKVVPFNQPFNYSQANNLGVAKAEGDVIVLLNNDIEVVSPDWLEQMLFYLEDPGVAIVGPMLIYPNRTVQHAGIVLGLRGTADHIMRGFPSDADGYAGSLSCPRDVSAVTGACLMMRKEEYLQGGGLVEYYGTHYQDVDICLCFLTSGRRIVYVPYAVLIHYEGASRGRDYDHLDRALLLDRWGEVITRGDPYYNPNFSLDSADYSIG
jgi:glycosyltransferase involved in cell wall biosynthesis